MSRLKKILRKYKSRSTKSTAAKAGLIVFVGLSVIGIIYLSTTSASTPRASGEFESGTRTTNARVITDSGASDGKAIEFGPAVTTPPPSSSTIDRSGYPDGTGKWAHLPRWQDWEKITWDISNTTNLKLDDSKVYLIDVVGKSVNPTDKFNIDGGRSWIISGLHMERNKSMYPSTFKVSTTGSSGPFDKPHQPGRTWSNSTTDPSSSYPGAGATFLRINGRRDTTDTRAVFRSLENFWAQGDWFSEGINYQRHADRNDTLVLNNGRVDRVNTILYNGGRNHSGGDIFQPWGGPDHSIIRDITGSSHYQGFFHQANAFNKATYTPSPASLIAERVNMKGLEGHAYLWWVTWEDTPGAVFDYTDVWVGTTDGRAETQTIWDRTKVASKDVRFGLVDDFAPPGSELGINSSPGW